MSNTPAAPLRIGLIGAGFMGSKHAEFIAANPDAVLAGVADPFNDTVAQEYGVPAYADHHELLAQPGLDGVIIVNPNKLHVGTALDCLNAGIPALLEKPVGSDYAETLRLLAAVEASDVPILVGHHRRHHPSVAAARDLVQEGGLGKLVAVSGLWFARKEDSYFDEGWHRQKGAGVMLINLVHDLDLLRYLVGEVATIQATLGHEARGLEVEDTASVIIRFENGVLGSFIASDAAASPWGWDQATEDYNSFPFLPDNASYFLSGSAGALSVPNLAHYSYAAGQDANWHNPMSKVYVEQGTGDSYTRQMAHFVDVVRGKAAPIVSVADAAQTLALIEAAREAGETGGTVTVSDYVARAAAAVTDSAVTW
ncbi:MAG: oxidoreductase [Pseudonocardiales bacterium]|jgi:predicted dehydrogenase|nr:oxidoreductase [Pseudonocardiales bacterium]